MVRVISFVLSHAGALHRAALASSLILLVSSLSGSVSPEAVSGEEVAPSPRHSYEMAYDTESDRIILFGGASEFGILTVENNFGDTWSYDLNLNAWTNMSPAKAPSPRWGPSMAYDTESDRVVLFGGGAGALSDETWAYDFNRNRWKKMKPLTRPLERAGNALAYDAESDRVVLFGGDTLMGRSNDTWTYDFNTDDWTETRERPLP